ncbi:hypothetical protein DL93DRAFT_1223265 [Clavulina sp. PMI_390]|nr:hypothetical protein DL93DRAFT_1223265 [Clavulina sp. PMI_390]
MAFLRRSRDAKAQSATGVAPNGGGLVSKPQSAKNFVPSKVIRAVENRRATAPQELSFNKGDFFYVTREVEYRGTLWYEVQNPNVGSRGLVPHDMFELLGKQAQTPGPLSTTGFPRNIGGPIPNPPMSAPPVPSGPTNKHLAFFAIVQYDFSAERPDELDARAGEAITVVAQSNREWFVAKPIGRLGGPGLIPVSFVELREPQSGRKMTEAEVNECMDRGTLPKVEVWKKATLDYKQSSIPLGVIDPTPSSPPITTPGMGAPPMTAPLAGGAGMNGGSGYGFSQQQRNGPGSGDGRSGSSVGHNDSQWASSSAPGANGGAAPAPGGEANYEEDEEELLPPGLPILATIPSFHQESGEYWFRVDVRWQPDTPSSPNRSPSSSTHEDYDPTSKPPPTPIAMVLYRNYDDFYAFQLDLLDTWPVEAGREKRHPSDPPLTDASRILPYMPGPVEVVNEAVTVERRRDLDVYVRELIALGTDSDGASTIRGERRETEYVLRCDLVRRFFSRKAGDVVLPPPASSKPSSSRRSERERERDREAEELRMNSLSIHEGSQNGHGNGHGNGNGNGYGYRDDAVSRSSAYSQGGYDNTNTRGSVSSYDGASQVSPATQSSALPPTASSNTSQAPPSTGRSTHSSGHSRSHSQSQSISTAQFLKVKIFHSSTDDLIAIRVSPRVTHLQLLEKIRDRLGADVTELRFEPESSAGRGKEKILIRDDEDLREWVSGNARLVLYAY